MNRPVSYTSCSVLILNALHKVDHQKYTDQQYGCGKQINQYTGGFIFRIGDLFFNFPIPVKRKYADQSAKRDQADAHN